MRRFSKAQASQAHYQVSHRLTFYRFFRWNTSDGLRGRRANADTAIPSPDKRPYLSFVLNAWTFTPFAGMLNVLPLCG